MLIIVLLLILIGMILMGWPYLASSQLTARGAGYALVIVGILILLASVVY